MVPWKPPACVSLAKGNVLSQLGSRRSRTEREPGQCFQWELFHTKKLHFSFIYIIKATAQIWEYLGARSFGRGTLSLENKTRNIAVFRNLISVWMSYVYSSPTMSPVFYFYQSVSFNVDNYFHFYAILKTERNICSTSYFFKCKHFSFVNGTC